jgi:hypothetical protein
MGDEADLDCSSVAIYTSVNCSIIDYANVTCIYTWLTRLRKWTLLRGFHKL